MANSTSGLSSLPPLRHVLVIGRIRVKLKQLVTKYGTEATDGSGPRLAISDFLDLLQDLHTKLPDERGNTSGMLDVPFRKWALAPSAGLDKHLADAERRGLLHLLEALHVIDA